MKQLKSIGNQHGSMSFLTVIFLSLLLTIVVLSFVRVSTREQRQAVDSDLSLRALYAAESGIEDAKIAIAKWQDDSSYDYKGNVCEPAEGFILAELEDDLATSYTCQFIDMTPGDFQDELSPWESITVPLSGVDPYSSVIISWHQDTTGTASTRTSKDLPPTGTWLSSDYPAMLRTSFLSAPATFNRDNVTWETGFLNPSHTPDSDVNLSVSGGLDGEILNADCGGGGEYFCSVRFNNVSSFGGASNNKFLNIQSLYRGTNIQVQLVGTEFDGVQASVDVTGRAGDVYRRLEARVSLDPSPFKLPNAAIWSMEEVCKNFSVTDNPADYQNFDCGWAN